MGYATPGHAEEHDYMSAFFENQDHAAVSSQCSNNNNVLWLVSLA